MYADELSELFLFTKLRKEGELRSFLERGCFGVRLRERESHPEEPVSESFLLSVRTVFQILHVSAVHFR